MLAADDDDDIDTGFIAYVPNTTDVGPILLIATLAIMALLLAVLPCAVILGDKYDQLEKTRSRLCDTDDDDDDEEEDENDAANKQKEEVSQKHQTDDSSVSSKESYYSAISGAFKEILDYPPNLMRPASHLRHRRRYRSHLDRQRILHDPAHYSIEMTIPGDTDEAAFEASLYEIARGARTFPRDPSEAGRDQVSLHDAQQLMSEYTISEQGEGIEMKVEGLQECDKPLIDRNACLSMEGFLDEMAAIMAWDVEMKRIIKLSIPFATQALFTGVLTTLTVAVVGKLIGTREVSAFVTVNTLLVMTKKVVGGFHESIASLCSQAIGAKKFRLAGKYVQISIILYTVFYLPFGILWVFFMDDAIRWFGFDEQTVEIGQQYGYVLVVDYLLDGLGEGVFCLLDVCGLETYATFIGATEELLSFLIILVWALIGSPTLLTVGLVEFVMGVVFLVINLAIIWCKGWFRKYRSGMLGTFALADKKAVKMVCKTSLSLSLGYLMTDGEWEVLTIFAGFLGPAEVAAWGIFGTIWDAINDLIDGISDASEVRCAFLLGSDNPVRARLSAYKSMMIGLFSSLFAASFLYMCGNDLPTWLTNDPTLQRLLSDLLPMFGLGNFAMCLTSMSWTLLGAQGRYRLATVVVALVSWCFTLPVSAVFSIHLKMNLEGQTAAVVLGYMIAGVIHSYCLFRSDWVTLSRAVMDDNCSRASDDSSVKDVPTKADEEMSEGSLLNRNVDEHIENIFAREATSSPSQPSTLRANLPKASSSSGLIFHQMGFSNMPTKNNHNALPSPTNREGGTILYSMSGEWNDGNEEGEDVGVEIFESARRIT